MWHNNIDYKIIVLCCNTRRKHGHWEVVSAEYIYLYWIYSANNSGIYGSWRVSVRPSGAGLGKTCVSWIYIFVLDIFCQHLGDIWQLEGVCAPFGRWVGEALDWGPCVSWIHVLVLDIFCQHLGDIWQLEGVCAPFGRWAGKQTNILRNFHGAKLSTVPNCPGAKLSGAKLSVVPNCPVPNCPVPNCPRCQIVRGAKLSGAKLS